ncbi:MAG: TonB family protein [Rhodospirillales bacterium]|nr:TonB family protein [Rhodospirillales bacterium]
MAHAVSLSYARSDHMSPVAVAMTTTLHLAVAAALYWISPLRYVDTTPDVIAITMEQEVPKPAEPPQPPPTPEPPARSAVPAAPVPTAPTPAPAAPTSPMRLGLTPFSPNPDPKATTPGTEQPTPPKPETPAQEATQPEPPKVEQQQALATPPPPPPPPPPARTLESELPPLDAPPPPVTSQEVPRPPAPPPPAPQAPPPTQPRVQPAPPPAPRPQQQQALKSSPLSNLPPPPSDQQASRQAPNLVNPAQTYGNKRLEDQYLWYVAQKLSQHQQFVRNATAEAGTVVLRITIARDGRLVDAGVSRSSGSSTLDSFTVSMVRAAGPYMPLPDDIPGAQHTFILPLNFRRN